MRLSSWQRFAAALVIVAATVLALWLGVIPMILGDDWGFYVSFRPK